MLDKRIAKLLSIASPPTGGGSQSANCNLNNDLQALLSARDGFFAFESALEVFPLSSGTLAHSLGEWNAAELWRRSYNILNPEGICFAQDVFGVQFVLSDKVRSFDPETGELAVLANSLGDWSEKILREHEVLTGFPLAHAWQRKNGPLRYKNRLVPKIPFVLGGKFELSNLVAMDSAKSMRLRAELALQLKDVPDGAQVIYRVSD